MRMYGIREQHYVAVGCRVNPKRSARKAGVPEGAYRIQLASITRKWRLYVPAKRSQNRLIGRRSRLGEFPYGELIEYLNAAARVGIGDPSAIQPHLGVFGKVVASTEKT